VRCVSTERCFIHHFVEPSILAWRQQACWESGDAIARVWIWRRRQWIRC